MMENVLAKPGEMDFDSKNLAATWKKWKQTMMLFMEAVMRNKTEKEKYSTFLYVIGQRGRDIFNSWKIDADECQSVDTLFDRFDTYCLPKRNVLLERRRFFLRYQQDETIDVFLTELRNLAASCDFGPINDELILYKIVDGTKSEVATERMLRKGSDLTLEKAIDICRAEELTRPQMSITTAEVSEPSPSARRPKRFDRSISFPEGLDNCCEDELRSQLHGGYISDGGCCGNSVDMNQCRRSNSGSEFLCTPRGRGPSRTCRRGSVGSIGKCTLCSCASKSRHRQFSSCHSGPQEWRSCQKLTDNRVPTNSCCNSCFGDSLYYEPGDMYGNDNVYQGGNIQDTTPDVEVRVPVVTYSDYPAVEIPRNENGAFTNRTEIMFVLKINGKLVRAQMGIRAEVDVMPKRVFDLVADANTVLNVIPMEHDPGEEITVHGSIEMICCYKDSRVAVNFYVMDTDTITMLTSNTCRELGVI